MDHFQPHHTSKNQLSWIGLSRVIADKLFPSSIFRNRQSDWRWHRWPIRKQNQLNLGLVRWVRLGRASMARPIGLGGWCMVSFLYRGVRRWWLGQGCRSSGVGRWLFFGLRESCKWRENVNKGEREGSGRGKGDN